MRNKPSKKKENCALFLTAFLGLIACREPGLNSSKIPDSGSELEYNPIRIASFNIENFGRSKCSKEEIRETLAEIVERYDLTAIQEVRDESGETIPYFVSLLNQSGRFFHYALSPRVGDENRKEQYAFVYDTETIQLEEAGVVYADREHRFKRPPYLARFSAGKFDFVLVTIHTVPARAVEEINGLVGVVQSATEIFDGERDFIILGDLNADCTYFSEEKNSPLRTDGYYWLIGDGEDTTVANTDCTYDRIILYGEELLDNYTGISGVFRFDEALGLNKEDAGRVSDHYPVWAEFYTDRW